jgi:hypothetical protein
VSGSHPSIVRRAALLSLVVLGTFTACSGGGDDASADRPAEPAITLPDLSFGTVDVIGAQPDPVGPAADTPEVAVDRFVESEVAGDFGASFDLLASGDRAELPTRAAWQRAHGYLPTLRGFERDTVTTVAEDTAKVSGAAAFAASLDDVRGLIPPAGRIAWAVVAEDGGWRVSYANSRIDPKYATPPGAEAVVEAWVAMRQRCETPPATVELAGGLVGATGLVDQLCGSSGASTTDEMTDLGDRAEADAVIAAYGPAADRWAHVVAVSGPVAMDVVIAPLDASWVVVGVLPPGA